MATAIARAAARPAGTPALRARQAVHTLACAASMLVALAMFGGTGIGATSDSKTVIVDVDPVLVITEPVAIDATPATTGSPAPAWTVGSPSTLDLGAVSGTEVASASLTWTITTNNPTGYSVQLSNTRATAPPNDDVMQTGGGDIFPDMGTSPAALDTGTTAFGVAVGDAVGHAQASVSYAGTPWGTTGGGGTQGTLYRNIPQGGMVVATQTSAQTNDPLTVNFAATHVAADLIPVGSYTGTMRLTATTL